MSKYTTYYNERQQMFRELAINWSIFAMARHLTDIQTKGMKVFFRSIGKRFGLLTDFKKIGVI
jgi:hypothetical protein